MVENINHVTHKSLQSERSLKRLNIFTHTKKIINNTFTTITFVFSLFYWFISKGTHLSGAEQISSVLV